MKDNKKATFEKLLLFINLQGLCPGDRLKVI